MNRMQMLSQFPQFISQMRGQNPDAIIKEMLNSGKITQEQLNIATEQAKQMSEQFNQFRGMFGK